MNTYTRSVELPAGSCFQIIKEILENSNCKFVSVADYDKKCVVLTVSGGAGDIMNLFANVRTIFHTVH